MEIRLSPELEAVIAGDVATGRFANAEEYLAEAVELLHEQETWASETLERQRQKLENSWQQAQRGELISLDQVREDMVAMKAEWKTRRQGA